MYQIFTNRLEYRYFIAVDELVKADRAQPSRRFGFSIMALECLLIETLAQFYLGIKTSDDARCERGHKLSNTEFYVGFLCRNSLKLNNIFDEDTARLFYKTIRCGILHQGETTGESKIVSSGSEIIRQTPNRRGVIINRDLFYEFVKEQEYKTYCNILEANSPVEYRQNLIRKMDYICHIPLEDGG